MVLRKLAAGYSNKEIALQLSLSNKTISTYKIKILRKLGIKSVVDINEIAKRNYRFSFYSAAIADASTFKDGARHALSLLATAGSLLNRPARRFTAGERFAAPRDARSQ